MKAQTSILLAAFPFLIASHPQSVSLHQGKPEQPQWIAPMIDSARVDHSPCPIMRLLFRLRAKPVSGVVRVVGLGHYLLRLNGRQVGDCSINQAWSEYNKTLYTQEFDISRLLRPGENAFGVMLGNSFWRVGPTNDTGRYSKTDAMPDFSNGHPYLLWLEARVRLASGSDTTIVSDAHWRWAPGPLTSSHIYGGEDYDARLEQDGWDAPGFDDHRWSSVAAADAPPAALVPLPGPGLKEFENFAPDRIRALGPGEFTYVFPQNCSALLRFTISGERGSKVRFKPCEYIDSTGRVKFTYTWGTNKDIWHDYTLRGLREETHQILFCYVGCQYVGIEGAVPAGYPNPDHLPVIRDLALVHVRTANRLVGSFQCSDSLQNAAERLIDWAIRSNMSFVATDCPHREKNGWQEENWHMARAISYRFDDRQWLHKIMHDVRDTQLPDGHIPTNCPNYLVGVPPHGYWNEAPEWGISGVLVPWHLYEWYGDTGALAESFESMKRYVDYLTSQAKDGLISSNLGDWYDYGHGKGDGPSQWTPAQVSATAIWALGARTVARAAEVLKLREDAEKFNELYLQIKRDFQRSFYNPATKMVKNNGSCQAANATALCVGLVPDEDRQEALAAIVRDLESRRWQQTTGEVLHIFLIRALAEGGRGDVLHKIYSREGVGSYGYMVKLGLTTLPESWEAKPGTGNSMNHFMLGQLMEWHYAYVAGIRQDSGSVGWRRIIIAPQPGDLRSASATFDSPAGGIAVSWTQDGLKFSLSATIPPGVAASALMPDGTRRNLHAGANSVVIDR